MYVCVGIFRKLLNRNVQIFVFWNLVTSLLPKFLTAYVQNCCRYLLIRLVVRNPMRQRHSQLTRFFFRVQEEMQQRSKQQRGFLTACCRRTLLRCRNYKSWQPHAIGWRGRYRARPRQRRFWSKLLTMRSLSKTWNLRRERWS